ncbi:hypothetical protein ACFRMQ_04505 [Kitasatospora sp. NPDC056783]|uniref:hypothetical protein n=1 Tax=Kitasatospora sp. NPDC056783 TaxID=3345943 RepID=UPI0036B999FC
MRFQQQHSARSGGSPARRDRETPPRQVAGPPRTVRSAAGNRAFTRALQVQRSAAGQRTGVPEEIELPVLGTEQEHGGRGPEQVREPEAAARRSVRERVGEAVHWGERSKYPDWAKRGADGVDAVLGKSAGALGGARIPGQASAAFGAVGGVASVASAAKSGFELREARQKKMPGKYLRSRAADLALDLGGTAAAGVGLAGTGLKAKLAAAGLKVPAGLGGAAGGLAILLSAVKATREAWTLHRNREVRSKLAQVDLVAAEAAFRAECVRALSGLAGQGAAARAELGELENAADLDPAERERRLTEVRERLAGIERRREDQAGEETAGLRALDSLAGVLGYAAGKRRRRAWKTAASMASNVLKIGAGGAAVAVAAGALAASGPVGWVLAGLAAVPAAGLAGYKLYRRYLAFRKEEGVTTGQAILQALNPRKKPGERKEMAVRLYELASGRDKDGRPKPVPDEVRHAAQSVLEALHVEREDGGASWEAYLAQNREQVLHLLEKKKLAS